MAIPRTATHSSAWVVNCACGSPYSAPGASISTAAACMPVVAASGSIFWVARLSKGVAVPEMAAAAMQVSAPCTKAAVGSIGPSRISKATPSMPSTQPAHLTRVRSSSFNQLDAKAPNSTAVMDNSAP